MNAPGDKTKDRESKFAPRSIVISSRSGCDQVATNSATGGIVRAGQAAGVDWPPRSLYDRYMIDRPATKAMDLGYLLLQQLRR